MIENNYNPWEGMASSTKRRVDALEGRSVFWITDISGKFGFYIQAGKTFDNLDKAINLKGISMVNRNSEEGVGELFLVLNDKDDWQIFYTLCMDLVGVTKRQKSDDELIGALEFRLKRWQHLLQKDKRNEMTLENQMGLFSELSCLMDVVALKTGYRQAVISWVGPDADKQDFLLAASVLEVKSYRTSKGETVYISSFEQLYSEKQPIFLITCALTTVEDGMNVEEIISKINKEIENESEDIISLFESKVIEYGYTFGMRKEALYKFKIDKMNCYKILPDFPRILSSNVDSRIKTIKYSIDLTQCREYQCEFSEINIKE